MYGSVVSPLPFSLLISQMSDLVVAALISIAACTAKAFIMVVLLLAKFQTTAPRGHQPIEPSTPWLDASGGSRSPL
jgi:hypothetical protein